ncbi:hypothetical protein HXX03_02335 [Acholeplasma laidlawii]|uniref:S26 family signal peptidase n=1 Tax=Acholeplasma laidlawii TaxID=2148 RepID=UPI0015ADB2EA|nr:S26 family signal peptidase [Acholeplasma laidlawii]NWH14310.1 hypothetical protein [Acholeplasma laidlawii]
MKNKSKYIRLIKNILYYGITFFLLIVIAVSLFIPNGLVKVFGIGWYRVVSESMEPLIMTGDYIVVVKDTDVESFEDGDIIIFETYFYNSRVGMYIRDVVTHHFYDIDDEGYILTYPHSQYNLAPELRRLDEWRRSSTEIYRLKPEDIIGRHQSTIKMSMVSAFITSPYGVAVIIINIGLVIGLIVLYQYDKHKKQEKLGETNTPDENLNGDTNTNVDKLDE